MIHALQLLVASWNDVTKASIVSSFRKSKTSAENQIDIAKDIDDPFKDFQRDLPKLGKSNPDLFPEE